MATNEFELSAIFPALPEVVFDAWMSSEKHGAMTGAKASVEARVGGAFTAWDGYLWGKTLEMERPRRIVQSWRTSEFPEESPDSRLEILLEKVTTGTKLTLRHSNLPQDQVESYRQGWQDSYFKPMAEYFG
jgi:activator of HSP90 ATPase